MVGRVLGKGHGVLRDGVGRETEREVINVMWEGAEWIKEGFGSRLGHEVWSV
jgi:hypothetical protein